MSAPSSPDEDDPTGVDNSPEEGSLEGFYQAVSLDDLLGSDGEDEEEGDVDGGSALAPRPGLVLAAAALPAGGSSPESATQASAAASDLPPNPHSLAAWVAVYFRSHADHAAPKTLSAKRLDLERFLNFTVDTLGHDHLDSWIPELTRAFLQELRTKPSPHTGKRLAPDSLRRCLATVRHFARWVGERHELAADPLHGIPSPRTRPSPPTPISRADLRRIWRACRARVDAPHRRDQCPLLDAAVFQLLVSTDLRSRELVALDLEDYHSKGLHGVFRRGRKVRTKTWVPAEARRWLERYLHQVRGREPGPLVVSRDRRRLSPKALKKALTRLGEGLRPGSFVTSRRLARLSPLRLV